MIYLKQYLFQHKGKVLLTVLLLLGQVVGTLLIPALLAELVDQGILAGNISVIWNTGVKMPGHRRGGLGQLGDQRSQRGVRPGNAAQGGSEKSGAGDSAI